MRSCETGDVSYPCGMLLADLNKDLILQGVSSALKA